MNAKIFFCLPNNINVSAYNMRVCDVFIYLFIIVIIIMYIFFFFIETSSRS